MHENLIYDWNVKGEARPLPEKIMFDDETLRDGLQGPSSIDPPIEKKIELLPLMDRLGIDTADIGLPGAGERARDRERALRKRPDCRRIVEDEDMEEVVAIVAGLGRREIGKSSA